ncbi:protein kinase [Nonomuraea sp. NPDC049725]|uniref:protein kinase domain-containing protein n=1 Tax=Nonomuraea sp. NPDC049725 TaxID=3154508 RepID=UPI003444ABA7
MTQTRKLGGRYRLLNPLGGGTLLLAFDEHEHRDVVVRMLRVPAESRELAVIEARRAAGFAHPSAVPLLDVLVDSGEAWLVMEFVSGASLEQSVRARRPLAVQQAARIGVCVLSALEAAHAAGIVHGRVNPANVLLTGTGRALLTGFGMPAPGMRESADLWSLAATLHFAVEGRPPGQAPATGADPLRTLIRAMLRPAGTPPTPLVAATLARLAVDTPLDHVLAARGPLPPGEVAAIGLAVLDQLTALHTGGACHGAVHPGAILLDAAGRATLMPSLAPARHALPPGPALGRHALPPPAPPSGPTTPPPGAAPPDWPQPAPPDGRTPLQSPSPSPQEGAPPYGSGAVPNGRDAAQGTPREGAPPYGGVAAPPGAAPPGWAGSRAPGEAAPQAPPASPREGAPAGRGDGHTPTQGAPPYGGFQGSVYAPPEGVVSAAGDLWSLGAVLFAAVEGRPPVPGAALARAGVMAPVLVGLLSGDPARRPAHGVLRRELLAALAHAG